MKLQQLESTSTNQHKPTQKPSCITDNLAIRHFIMDKEKHIVFDICTNNQSTNHSNIITSFILYILKACQVINYIALHCNSLRFSHISGYLVTIQCSCVNQNIAQQKEHIKINQQSKHHSHHSFCISQKHVKSSIILRCTAIVYVFRTSQATW